MSIQSIGKFGDITTPQPATPQQGASAAGNAPKPDTLKLQAPPQQAVQPAREDVQEAIEAIKGKVEPMTTGSFEFSLDKETGTTIVRITDRQTAELIRQIPAKELVDIAKNLDRMLGLLLRQQA